MNRTVQAAIDRGDVVPRAVYEACKHDLQDTAWRMSSGYWAALRLACLFLQLLNAADLADRETLAGAAEAMGWAA